MQLQSVFGVPQYRSVSSVGWGTKSSVPSYQANCSAVLLRSVSKNENNARMPMLEACVSLAHLLNSSVYFATSLTVTDMKTTTGLADAEGRSGSR